MLILFRGGRWVWMLRGIRKVFDLAAKMKDPINFSIGLPDFDVPEIVKQAAIEAIEAGNNRYTQTQGLRRCGSGCGRIYRPSMGGTWERC